MERDSLEEESWIAAKGEIKSGGGAEGRERKSEEGEGKRERKRERRRGRGRGNKCFRKILHS